MNICTHIQNPKRSSIVNSWFAPMTQGQEHRASLGFERQQGYGVSHSTSLETEGFLDLVTAAAILPFQAFIPHRFLQKIFSKKIR